MVVELSSVCASVHSLFHIHISPQLVSQLQSKIKFYLKHHWGGGKVVLGFGLGQIRTLVSDSSQRLTMGNALKNLLLRNHMAQSFHTFSVAMYSGPLYKSCQLCPWGPYRHPWGRHGKNIK